MERVIKQVLDNLLAEAADAGGSPVEWRFSQDAFEALLKSQGRAADLHDPNASLPDMYDGIPLEVVDMGERGVVSLEIENGTRVRRRVE